MSVPAQVQELVERFDRHLDDYKRGKYNETQVRREFIDPFFKAMGWDIDNTQGYAETYKEVVHEDAIKIGRATKAPDYSFRIGGVRKFFLEAKKPSVDIKRDTHPAYQLRRYAWSAKLPLSILTDFEEFAVYDGRIKPDKADQAAAARVMYFTYQDYFDQWPALVDIFSPESIKRGSFDKYVESKAAKRGTAEVDAAFLQEIERWRDVLARNLALRNRLTPRQLNYAVQQTIDRLIFLRIAEDRGIERYGQLGELAKADNIYPRLFDLFARADERYNSGLFHFKAEKDRPDPDTFTPALTLDDKVLKDIFKNLYYPDSPYEFSVLPADILGQVYEQFLGKVIRLTAGGQAKVEDKPEVKKAGGVYYTPTYIVEYIVRQTVGKLVEGQTPTDIGGKKPLRVADPACGSGSFLLGAYQFLLDWYLNWYLRNDPGNWAKKKNAPIYPAPTTDPQTPNWKLIVDERKRILLTHLYGVDIDPQAVEVTKLSLLLKVLEDEQSVTQQLGLFQERVLPDLDHNIKCGNSLIGPDFYEGQQMGLGIFDEEERYRINAFDWQKEFPQVFAREALTPNPSPTGRGEQPPRLPSPPGRGAGGEGHTSGFDAVIGNPPYGATLSEIGLKYLRTHFKDESQSYDTYELFLLKASKLLKTDGRLSMIIPASWLTGDKYHLSRQTLLASLVPSVAYVMPFDVFKAAYIDTAIVVFAHSGAVKTCLIHYFPKKEKLLAISDDVGTSVPVESIRDDSLNRLSVVFSQENTPILTKLKATSLIFKDWFDIQRGVQPYSRKKHSEKQIAERFLHATSKLSEEYLPELQGNELSRYWIASERVSHLRFCDDIASKRPIRMFQGKRIVLRRLLTRKFRLQASMTSETMITTDNVLNIVPNHLQVSVPFTLGLLNSKLISWLYVNTSMVAQKDDFPQVHISALATLPIPKYDSTAHDRMVSLVEQMLKLNQQLAQAQTPQDKTMLKRQLETTDRQIDKLVYELYNLQLRQKSHTNLSNNL